MKFYRRLRPFEAISFDLDDTLYDNKPVLLAAESRLLDWLGRHAGAAAADGSWWTSQKRARLAEQPQLRHDTTRLRHHTLERGLITLGSRPREARELADGAMALFLEWRSEIAVTDEVKRTLDTLARTRPLVAITNGNANLARFWPDAPFQFSVHAGPDGRMKPDSDLFAVALARLAIAPESLLHVGDHPGTDIQGANRIGCQSGWLTPPYGQAVRPLGLSLPTFAFSRLDELLQLPSTG
ncbi:HAD family hydrolase [Ferrimonas sediminicola]|uniref:HAD family hydrolase n=1 Tax=Ferrimonas sediminicola TaxID=2569538 RepID=A0A4U1BKH7_9GAMM|nr:HAD-IA family hydrolase [Ferrimonas sediminicola]TKB51117.1 HAD family hydrolase [Ferrimonas sediminicola]